MEENWISLFGFKKNPYSTMALSASEEGSQLLIGRDSEVDFIAQQITSDSMITLLYGDNGVGKSSIANVVAYRMGQTYSKGDRRYFFLKLRSIDNSNLVDFMEFQRSIFLDVIFLLLEHKAFLRKRGVKSKEIYQVQSLCRQMGNIGGGIGAINLNYTPNPSAEQYLPYISRKWLEKCFSGRYSGGIICVVDNLENCGTSNIVKSTIEKLRDSLFMTPGLVWILCGTSNSVEGVRGSRLLQGYIAEKEVKSLAESVIPELIEQRINYYSKANKYPPVDKDIFEIIYGIVNKQLRVALTLCQEFALFLHQYPVWRSDDRMKVFRSWIDQMASELPSREYDIPYDSWELFERIITWGSDVSSNDLDFLNIDCEEKFNSLSLPLKSKRLLEMIDTDEGF